MKSIEEIQRMTESEIRKYLVDDNLIKKNGEYLNAMLGDTSFLLAGLLDSLLKERSDDWDHTKWIDDSLIIEANKTKNKICIWGIMIWGKKNTTEQWTDPFYFEIKLSMETSSLTKFTFLFCDLNTEELSYKYFRENRNYWDAKHRDWKYILNW